MILSTYRILDDLYNLNEGDFSDDELDSASPLLDLYIQDSGGRGVVKTMTPFTFLEFERIWDQVGVDFMAGMTNGRGPTSTTKPKDIFFIILSVLKDPSTWDKVGVNFAMKGQKAQRIVTRGISVLAPLVKSLFVREVSKDSFQELNISDCNNYPYVHHITDASVLPIHRPLGTHAESKAYFSGEVMSFFFMFTFFI